MELTIEQALQHGVAAFKEGKLQEAKRFYRAILQSQLAHPSANHNLGVIAVSANKVEAALPLFKTALEANPKIEQFWLSYIDALIKAKQPDTAKQVIEQAKMQGVDEVKLKSLEIQLPPKNQKPDTAILSPPQEQLKSLLEHYQNGQFGYAENLARSISQEFPQHHFSWKVLGAILGATGRNSEALYASQTAVALSPQDAEAHNNLGITLNKLGRLEEAEASYTQALALKPDYAEAHYNLGVILQKLVRLDEAEVSYTKALALKSDFVEAYNNLGIILKELGRLDEAEASYIKALGLKHNYAEAHSNLGVTLQELGRLEEAEASFTQALILKPDYAEAHSNLGMTLKELGRLNEAESSYTKAITLKPDYATAHSNLGNTLKELGRLDEAVDSYSQAIALKPDFAGAYVNLGIAIIDVRFKSSNPKLYEPLTQLLTKGNFTYPKDVAPSILSLLKHDIQIKNLVLEKNISMSLNEAIFTIVRLDKLMLLHRLMRVCPLPDLQFEEFCVVIRSLLLKNLDKIVVSPEIIYFLSTLCLHCFTNEYVYIESDEETNLISELQAKISQTVARLEQPEALELLCLAAYRPLHRYDWCQKLECLDNLEEVKKRLIEEPLLEKTIAKDIPVLEEISDDVSLKVREQYEENPFPRWVKLKVSINAKPIASVCNELKLQLYSENIKNVTAPSILIAGCGTGQHSIGTASRFSNCRVTAVDLSLASLAYAKRKSNELGLYNLEYLQADILHLDQIGREFDIIESAGVLHHMDEPLIGWKVLVNLLKSGGLMKIGLYSELARHEIAKVRKEITMLKVGTSETDIRKFRQSLVESHDENHQLLTAANDFFSLSTVRDLIFHVKEHRFTLPQIKNCLDELGLKFCGFENKDATSNFKELYRNEVDIHDLELWHQYEERNPQAFSGMYQFWCQKP